MRFRVVNSTAKKLIGYCFESVETPKRGDVVYLCKKEDCKKYGTQKCDRNYIHKKFEIINSIKVGKLYKFLNSNITLLCRVIE